MAWEQRGSKKYLYCSVRRGQAVTKLYLDCGDVARLAEADAELRRAERQAAREQRKAEVSKLEAAEALLKQLEGQCLLLLEAVLLAEARDRESGLARHQQRDYNRIMSCD